MCARTGETFALPDEAAARRFLKRGELEPTGGSLLDDVHDAGATSSAAILLAFNDKHIASKSAVCMQRQHMMSQRSFSHMTASPWSPLAWQGNGRQVGPAAAGARHRIVAAMRS